MGATEDDQIGMTNRGIAKLINNDPTLHEMTTNVIHCAFVRQDGSLGEVTTSCQNTAVLEASP